MKSINRFTSVLLSALLLVAVSCNKEEEGGSEPSYTGMDITGTVTYTDGSPASGVVVSDGYTCCVTDASGKYSMKTSAFAYYIMYSIPSDVKVEIGTDGLPCFYKKLQNDVKVYDFTLTKQAVETKFRILGVGDIQVKDGTHITRYMNETQADLKEFKNNHTDMPVYAIHMGDLVANKWDLYPDIIPKLDAAITGVPMFQTIGNHDHQFPKANNIAAQRTYESYCGPVNYSFNRGDLHIVVMDDIIHSAEESSKYDGGFLPFQYEWLQQDLSHVSKDKGILLSVHIPFREYFFKEYGLGDKTGCYWTEVLTLISEYASYKIISGHVHVINNTYNHKIGTKYIQEYALGAACGAHWTSTVCYDGAPNGYGVMEYDGATLKNYYYKSTKKDAGFQMRIYYAPDFPDFEYNGDPYKWGLATLDGTYVVNIWNMTDSWTTEVFLDGQSYGSLIQKDFADACVLHYYYENTNLRGHLDSASGKRHHMYYFRPKNKGVSNFTEMKVVATDPFGNRYECTKITKDWSEFLNY